MKTKKKNVALIKAKIKLIKTPQKCTKNNKETGNENNVKRKCGKH